MTEQNIKDFLTKNTALTKEKIEDYVNLEELYLHDITDIRPLKKLGNLKWLYLQCNEITDLTPLQELVNLEWLESQHDKITDLKPLKGLVSLKWLVLRNNNITDTTPLKGLVNLERLKVNGITYNNKDVIQQFLNK